MENSAESSSGPVLYYMEAVIDHFSNSRNVGELSDEETNGFARIGDPGCWDEMMLWLRVHSGVIEKPVLNHMVAQEPYPRAAC